MKTYFLPLKSKRQIAEQTMEFVFERPKDFIFKAGQTIDLGLADMVYTFSIAAGPEENVLRIATRIREESKFKQALAKLEIGDKVRIQGPSGDFTLRKKTDQPIILVAGGIGITPFMSMLTDAFERHLPHKISLLYFNSNEVKAAYLDELTALTEKNKNFKLEIHFGKADFKPDKKSFYYVCGPPAMIATALQILDENGIDEDNVRTEEFSGY